MANPITIGYIQEKTLPALKKAGVLRSSIFGSFARNEAGPESDVDLLVEFPEDKTMLDLIELQDNLEASLGKKVDLVTFRSIHHLLRDRILREQVPIL